MRILIVLSILVFVIISCSDLAESRERLKERGVKCTYNYKGEVQYCDYIN